MPKRPIQTIGPPTFSLSTLARQLRRLTQYRDLLYTLTLHRINLRYKQSVLGYCWAVLHPVLLMLIYSAIFSRFVHVPTTNDVPYTVFAFSALLPWTFFSTGLSTATMGLVVHSNLLLKVYFPREIIPLSYVLAAFVDFLLASLVLSTLMLYYHVPISTNVLWAIPAIIALTVFLAGLALLVSAFHVQFRDVGLAIPLLLQIWMFASPIVYSLASVPTKLRGWYKLNPMVGIVETFRGAILQGASPDSGLLCWSFAVSLATAICAYAWFKNVEATFADNI